MMMVGLWLYSSFMHTYKTAQVAELQQWQHHYLSLVVRRSVKQCFTFVGQAWFVCFLLEPQYFSYIMAVI